MKTSKILMSTFVAAAAMNLPAFGATLSDAVLSFDAFTGDAVSALTTDGWSLSNNITGTDTGVFTSAEGNTQATISAGTSGASLTTLGSGDRYTYSAIFTVDKSVFETTSNSGVLLAGTESGTTGVAVNNGGVAGAWGNAYWSDSRNNSISNAASYASEGGFVTIGVTFGEGDAGTTVYVLGADSSAANSSLRGSTAISTIGLENLANASVSYSNLYWFNTALSADEMTNLMSVVGNSYVWAGTEDSNTWDTASTLWLKDGSSAAFAENSAAVFGNAAAVRTVAIDSAVSASTVNVLDDYTFNVGESGSLSADSISVSDGKTATLNLASAMTLSANLDGAGTLRKTGAGALTYSGTIESGSTLEIASGGTLAVNENGAVTPQDANVFSGTLNNGATLNISGGVTNVTGAQKLNGNVVIASSATLYSATADAVTWRSPEASQTIEVLGTLHLDARWSMGTGKEIVLAGGTITGTGGNNDGISGVALDYYDGTGKISVAENTSGSSIEANIAVRTGTTLTFDANSDLSVSGNLISYESGNSNSVTASGSMHISKTGAGTMTLSGDNKQASTTISEGKIVAASANALGTGTVTVSGGELEIAVADGGTLTQSSAWTTTGNGKISVSAGTLALTGEVNLASAIEVASGATVTVSENVVFALSGLTGTEGESGTTYSLISLAGGATLGSDWTGLSASNLDVSGTTIVGRDLSSVSFSDAGSVTVSGGAAGDIVWNGSADNSTWDTASTNWKIDGNTDTKFFNKDNVTFNDSASYKTVTLADGSGVVVGTMTVESGTYTLTSSTASSAGATVSGSTLTVAAGASLTAKTVDFGFDDIAVAGTLTLDSNNFSSDRALSWSQLTFQGGTLHIEDTQGNANFLTIGSVVMDGDGAITSTWSYTPGNSNTPSATATLAIGSLSGTGNLSITGGTMEPINYSIGSIADDYSGTLSISKSTETGSASVGLSIGSVLNAENASLDIGAGVSFSLLGGEGLNRLKNLTLGENVTLALGYGVGLTYERMTMKDGSVLNLENGSSYAASGSTLVGGTNSVLFVDNATTNGITINGSLFGNNTNISGVIEGNGKVKFANGTGNNAFTVSANIRDGNEGAISIHLAAGASQSVTFSGANTYSGGTLVTSGTLVAANASALGMGALSIDNSAGAAKVSASVANVELHDTSITFADSTIANAVLTIASDDASFTVVSDATLYLDIGALTDSVLTAGEEVALSIAAANAFGDSFFGTILVGTYEDDTWVNDATWIYKADSWNSATGTLSLVSIPEPSAFGLLAGAGALALVASRRRRNKR